MLRKVKGLALLRGNTKLDLPVNWGGCEVRITGLTLAPHRLSGYGNVCPMATAGCQASCVLWFSGRRVQRTVRAAAIERTRLYFLERDRFCDLLNADIEQHYARCLTDGAKACVRLNVASDIDFLDVVRSHPTVRFFDYTKVVKRFRANIPANYDLSLSRSERTTSADMVEVLGGGRNVVVVCDASYNPQSHKYGVLPKSVEILGNRYHTVDGDMHDCRIREIDGSGRVVLLRVKGTNAAKAAAISSGFAVHVADRTIADRKGVFSKESMVL